MPQLNLSDEMLDTLIEAITDAIDYTGEIMDEEEKDEFVEYATRRHEAQIEALQMLEEVKLAQ